jgi:glutamate:GABA antiporter
MNAVHVGSLQNPCKESPHAMFFACGLVLLIFVVPALAISWVIPAEQLSLTAGVMPAFEAFFAYFNLQALVPIVAIALVCASADGMLTWLAGQPLILQTYCPDEAQDYRDKIADFKTDDVLKD